MNYCTFEYEILYKDGSVKKNWAPFRKEGEINDSDMRQHVEGYFSGPNFASIIITSKKIFNDEKEWYDTVKYTPEFKALNKCCGFAGDLIAKYEAPE